jgi:hypothetical protein
LYTLSTRLKTRKQFTKKEKMKKGSNANSKPSAFGKKREGKAKNLNTPKGKKVSKYRGQGR